MRVVHIAPAVMAIALAGCRHRAATTPTLETVAADSLRGIVQRVGNEPRTQLLVRAADDLVCLLRSSSAAPVDALDGLEVTLWGARTYAAPSMMPSVSCDFDAARFAVRAVDGIAAIDGLLRADGTSFVLETAIGERQPLREVPSALRTQLGARIFWAGPLDRTPQAYGVLVPAPR